MGRYAQKETKKVTVNGATTKKEVKKTLNGLVEVPSMRKRVLELPHDELLEVLDKLHISLSGDPNFWDKKAAKNEEVRSFVFRRAYDEAEQTAKLELGGDFAVATTYYMSLYGINKKLNPEDFPEIVHLWKVMSIVSNTAEMTRCSADTVDKAFNELASMGLVAGAYQKDNKLSKEQRLEFIASAVDNFKTSIETEYVSKEQIDLMKGSFWDFALDDEEGGFTVDTTKFVSMDSIASDTLPESSFVVVKTAEDGISRILRNWKKFDVDGNVVSVGVRTMVLSFGDVPKEMTEEEADYLIEKVMTDGFIDKTTGRRFRVILQNPSMSRKGEFLFGEADSWEDVFSYWLAFTMLTKQEFEAAFGGEDHLVNIPKMIARVSSRGSNSKDVSDVSPEYAEKIRMANIEYVADAEILLDKKYRTLTAPDTLSVASDKRKLTPGDGQMLIDVTQAALWAVAYKIISKAEYDLFSILWEQHCSDGKNIEDVRKGSKLGKLISKIPPYFQIRHGEKKGMAVMTDLHNYLGRPVDIVCPSSVRKYIGREWSEYPLEVCNWLKKKGKFVNLNPQFIEALEFDDPEALIPIVKDWLLQAKKAAEDPAMAMAFARVVADFTGDKELSNLEQALSTCSLLYNDKQINKWRLKQFEKLISNMKIGKIAVPGQYSYMIMDPKFLLNQWYGLNLDHLQSGEYYHNGNEYVCGLFRSPLIHPFEVQKVQTVTRSDYWFMHDAMIFNGYDGAWDAMGGGDFDGDQCAIVPDNTWQGEIVVSGIRENEDTEYEIWEPAPKSEPKYFRLDGNDNKAIKNLINKFKASAKRDRTGIITNYATRALDISNHMRSLVAYAKKKGCDKIYFIHPEAFSRDGGRSAKYGTEHRFWVEGNILCTRAVIGSYYDTNQKKIIWTEYVAGSIGKKTLEEVMELSNKFLDLDAILRILQGREIDGAKTGVYAEGAIEGRNDYTETVKIGVSPRHMLARQIIKGRIDANPVSEKGFLKENWRNSFISYSPLGRVYSYIQNGFYNPDGSMKNTWLLGLYENGVNNFLKLCSLLTKEEEKTLCGNVTIKGKEVKLMDLLDSERTKFSKKLRNLCIALNKFAEKSDDDDQVNDVTMTINAVKTAEAEKLTKFAKAYNVPLSVITVGCYGVAYNRNSQQNDKLTFGWLLMGDLLEVFSRANEKWGWFRIPERCTKVSVLDDTIICNEKAYKKVEGLENCNDAMIKDVNGRRMVWLKRTVDRVVNSREVAYSVATANVTAYGFKFCKSKNSRGFLKAIRDNGNVADIKTVDGRLSFVVSGQVIGTMPVDKDFETYRGIEGKKVQLMNMDSQDSPMEATENSIKNIVISVIGKAD